MGCLNNKSFHRPSLGCNHDSKKRLYPYIYVFYLQFANVKRNKQKFYTYTIIIRRLQYK